MRHERFPIILLTILAILAVGLTPALGQELNSPILERSSASATELRLANNLLDDQAVPLALAMPSAGSVLELSGTDSYVETPHDPALNPVTAFTVEAWVKRDDSSRCETIISKGFTTSYWLGFCNQTIRFYATGTGSSADGNTVIPADVWTHIAVVYQGSGRRYYINGELDYQGGLELTPTTNAEPVFIGADPPSGGYGFDGRIASVRLWNVARTQDDIRRTMHVALDEPLPGLVANWRLDGDYEDNIGGFHGTGVGASFAFDEPPAQPAYANVVDESFNALALRRYAAATAYVATLDRVLVIGGQRGVSQLTDDVDAMDGSTGNLTTLANLPTPLANGAAAYVPSHGTVYVFGGNTSSSEAASLVDSIYAVDPTSGTVRTVSATLPVTANRAVAVYHAGHDKVVLLGGYGVDSPLDTISIFDPTSEALTVTASLTLPHPLYDAAAIYSPGTGHIYLFGGHNGTSRVDTIYELALEPDGLDGTITLLTTSLPRAADGLRAVSDPYTHLVYLIAGDQQEWLWAFDPITSQIWRTQIPQLSGLDRPSAAFSHPNRHAVIIGGSSTADYRNVWRIPLGDGPLVPLGRWDFPNPVGAAVNGIDSAGPGVVVATQGDGAWLYESDGTRDQYTPAALGSVSGIVNDASYDADNGYVWLATDDAGAKIDDGGSITTYGNTQFGTDQLLSTDKAGLYGTGGQGLWWRGFNPIPPPGGYFWVQNFTGESIKALALRSSRDLWLLSADNLKHLAYDLFGNGTETGYGSQCGLLNPTDLTFGGNGDWWIVSPGTFEFGGSGVCRIPAADMPSGGATVAVDDALGNVAEAVDVDADGRVWVALVDDESNGSGGLVAFGVTTDTGAIVRNTEYNWQNAPVGSLVTFTGSIIPYWDSSFTAVGAADERVWGGKPDGRLITLAQRWQQIDQSNDIDGQVIQNVWTVRGRAFLATSTDLHVLMPDGKNWDSRSGVKVWDVLGDRQGRIWVATNTGIRLYTPDGWDYLADRPGDRPATATYALAEDQDGRIWIGGLHGLTLFDRERFVATFTPENSGLPDDTIRTLYVDGENRLWAGTDVGLSRLDGVEWTVFTTADGLPDDRIHDLDQLGSGQIAISTFNGVSFYDGAFATQILPIEDSDLPLSVDESGRLWAGSAVLLDGDWQVYYTTNSGLASDQISDNATDGADRIWFSHAPDAGISVRGTYLPPLANVIPVITSVFPVTGTAGTELTINGSGFGGSDVRVTVGQAQATVLSGSPTEIRVRLTEHNISGDVSVSVGGRRSTLTDSFCAIPTLESFTPTGGNDGVRIHIYGQNFDPAADVFLGSDTERAPYVADATHLWLDVRPGDGIGPVRVVNHCGHTASSVEQFRRITLDVAHMALNQGIQSTGLVANRRTLVQHYLSHSIAPRDTDSLEVDYMELTFTEGGNPPRTYGVRHTSAFTATSGSPAPAMLRDVANSVNAFVTPYLDGDLISSDNVEVQSVLKRGGQVVAQGVTSVHVRPDLAVRVLLVPIMRNGYDGSDLRALKQSTNANLDELKRRIWPTGRVELYWSPTVYTVDDVLFLGGETLDLGDTLQLYDASHNLDSARRYWNELYDPDVMIAFGVVEDDAVVAGSAGGKAFWPDVSQALNLAGLEALDTLCDIGATALNVITFGLADASCDLELPLYVGWGIESNRASSLIGHEMGHIFGLARPPAPNADLTDNATHSVMDELDNGECATLLSGGGALYNPDKTLYRSVAVNDPVVNPLTGVQLRPSLTVTGTSGGIVSEALAGRGKAIMSYACGRGDGNSFFEPADVLGIFFEYAAAPARNFFDDLLPGRTTMNASAAGVVAQTPTPVFVAGTRLYVSGLVDRAANTGELRRVEVLGDVAPLDVSYETGYWLVQLDGSDRELARTGVFPVFSTTSHSLADEPETDTGFFAATILAEDGVAVIELRHEETVLDSLSAGSSAPTIAISSPSGGSYSSGTIPVTWTASDADGDDLSVAILYSADGGANWLPVGFSSGGSGTKQIPVANLSGSSDARIKVVASDGFHMGEVVSAAFGVAAQPPLPFIGAPADESSFLEGQLVALSGGAADNQDLFVESANLSWESDRDGDLGTGEALDVLLNVGTHVLTLRATNSQGLSATAAVTITVVGDYDYDGLTDDEELADGMNLLTSVDAFSDSDGDGLSYVVERKRGLNPNDPDSDGDGRLDDDEVAEGTDPTAPDAPLPADSLSASPASLTFDADLSLGTAMPQAQVLLTSRESVGWSLTADVDWLAAVHVEGQTPGSTLILVNTERLPGDGTYTGNLFFDSDLGLVTMPVTATVTNLEPGDQLYLPLMLKGLP